MKRAWVILMGFLMGQSSLWATHDPNNPCVPEWGDWQVGQAPSIKIEGNDPDPIGVGESASVSVNITTTSGTKFREDINNCEHREDAPLEIGSQTVSWTASNANPSSGSGTTASFTPISAGESQITFNAEGKTTDPDGTYTDSKTLNLKVVEVQSLTPSEGTEIDDGDGDGDTKSYVVCAQDSGTITVKATPNPSVPEDKLPSSWTMEGGQGSGKLERTVSKTTPDTPTITAKSGTSSKTTKIYVIKVQFSAFDGLCEDTTLPVNVTINPSLPSGLKATLKLTTRVGTGSATFSDGTVSKEITGNTSVTIKGVTASSDIDNIRLFAEIKGNGVRRKRGKETGSVHDTGQMLRTSDTRDEWRGRCG